MHRTQTQIWIGAVALALPVGAASAGTISFDPADGYALGTSLVVNPDWAGNGGLFSITSLGGGNGAAQSSASPQGAFSNNRFVPGAAFLGTPDTSTAGQAYDFSFDLRNDSTGSLDDFGLAHRLRLGGTDGSPMVSFEVFNNGRLQIGGTNAQNINGASLDLDDLGARFITIEGVIDIDAGTFDVDVDGVSQGTFSLLNTPSSFGQVTFQRHTTSADPVRQVSVDNLSIEVVPEPASAALLGAGLLGVARRRRSA
ncbi:MAG: PEP-CTERM sorting domain-containing protein [Planctomycetota bacterium]